MHPDEVKKHFYLTLFRLCQGISQQFFSIYPASLKKAYKKPEKGLKSPQKAIFHFTI